MNPIEQGAFVSIHGMDQWIAMRGDHERNPALLILHGPGFATSPMTPFFAPWHANFTVVHWDQPGAGSTYAKNGPQPLTLDGIAKDGVAVVEWLQERLNGVPVVLLATSGGTIIGLKMIKARPDLFAAYAGTGQIVNWAAQESLSYSMILDHARTAADTTAIAELESIGEPPYRDVQSAAIKGKYANAMTPSEQTFFASIDPVVRASMRTPPAGVPYVAAGLPPADTITVATSAYSDLMPQIGAFDARELGLKFAVPMFFFQGEQDMATPASAVVKYVGDIEAPKKELFLIPDSGHMSFFLLQRGDLCRILQDKLRIDAGVVPAHTEE